MRTRSNLRTVPLLVSVTAVGAVLMACGHGAAPRVKRPAYRDPTLSIERRVEDLLVRMTPEEKFGQLFMVSGDLDGGEEPYKEGLFGLQFRAGGAREQAEKANDVQKFFVERTRLGIPVIFFEEALHGLVQPGATAFPQAIGLAATWDIDLAADVAAAVAAETAGRGIRQVLSPVVNLARDIRWGRTEETYGEDPYLSARMAAAFVDAFERRGIITTPKHFAANVGAGGRDSYPIAAGERELRQTEFVPFLAAVREGGARSVMTSYNSWDGRPNSANRRLLEGILKDEWGFRGFVISDANAVGGMFSLHLTADSYLEAGRQAWASGLDVIFQSEIGHAALYRDAVIRGLVDRTRIDDAVRRVLRAKFALGLFEDPFVDLETADRESGGAAHRALALKAARDAIVLLKNDAGVLPLARTLRSIAVIGPDAVEARLGGYSRPPGREVSLLDAMRERAAAAGLAVRYAPGCGRAAPRKLAVIGPDYLRPSSANDQAATNARGLAGEYYTDPELAGAPAVRRVDPKIDFHWTFVPPAPGLATDWYAVRWTGSLVAPETGPARIGVEGDGFRLWLDGRLVLDRWRKSAVIVSSVEARLEKGRAYDVRLEFHEPVRSGEVRLVWDYGPRDDSGRKILEAVELARASDVAVVAAGVEEGEGRDRSSIRLPGRQGEMIRRVAATGVPTIVVLYGGSAIDMTDWLDAADAVLMAWYPGEEGGRAVADVLWGEADPAGRLPVTFPRSAGQLPLVYDHEPTGRLDDYLDSTGEPLFPFGYGLSYTEFLYSDLAIAPTAIPPGGTARVSLRIENAGQIPGAEAVQLYVHDPLASVTRPVLALKGFRKVFLEPGAATTVSFELGPRELALLDDALREVVEPGEFQVYVGGSSRDIRLKGVLTVR
jgi:beta-glucosidase